QIAEGRRPNEPKELAIFLNRESAIANRKSRKVSSSIGRVAVSKTVGWGFESLLTCWNATRLNNPEMITKTKNFFAEVRTELQKASWPWESKEKGIRRYKELTDSTLVVIIAMLLMG